MRIEGANNQRSPHPPPRRKIGEVPSPLPEGKKPQNGLPIPESVQWIWQVRKKIWTRLSLFPPPDPTANPKNSASASTSRNAGEGSLLEESLSGTKCTQWSPLTMRTVGPLESRLVHALLPSRRHTDCVYPHS